MVVSILCYMLGIPATICYLIQNEMKKKFLLFLFSISLVLGWGITMVAIERNASTCFFGLAYAIIGTYIIQRELDFELDFWDKMVLLSMPLIYLFLSTSIQWVGFSHFLMNPIFIGLTMLSVGLIRFKNKYPFTPIFFLLSTAMFYSFFLFPSWEKIESRAEVRPFSAVETQENKLDSKDEKEIILSDFLFMNHLLDTVNLNPRSRYVLLETWNETCIPCLESIEDLAGFYDENENQFEVYFLYENRKKEIRENYKEIFSFSKIETKDRILVDLNQDLYRALGIQGYPYFLIFNPEGELVYQHYGYLSSKKKELIQEISDVVGLD